MLKYKLNRNVFMCGIVLLIMQFFTLAVRTVSYAAVKGVPLTLKAVIPTSVPRFFLFWGMGVAGIVVLLIACTVKMGNALYADGRFATTQTRTKKLVMCALLLAMCGVVSLVEIMPVQEMKITFTFLFIGLCGYLYGPATGMAFGAGADIVGYIINPAGGMLFPGFTLTALISGMIYGVIMHRKATGAKMPLWRVIAAKSADTLICNIILNTFCCSLLYGDTFIALLPMRIAKNLIMLPIEAALLFGAVKLMERYGRNV